jgi:hypothetical protein
MVRARHSLCVREWSANGSREEIAASKSDWDKFKLLTNIKKWGSSPRGVSCAR